MEHSNRNKMKLLPIGKQNLKELITENYVYVDKTEIIHKLITTGSNYFLSRPRRFGKSLTVSTLMEIFSGNKELFKGLWIYDKIVWKKYPIIYLDFSDFAKKSMELTKAIKFRLDEIAKENNIQLKQIDYSLRFRELIRKMSETQKVVILVDEYDKPIIDHIENIPKAEANREILKNFYSVLKSSSINIKFLFITGVSKFAKVSIFSDLNHLSDITVNPNYSFLVGYTQNELDFYFKEYISEIKSLYPENNISGLIKDWYNGYSWDGEHFVYNPFSLLNFFDNKRFSDYWFQTGTPTFLMTLIKSNNYKTVELAGLETNISLFDKYEINKLQLIPLLFQTGYLTIKKLDPLVGRIILDYPNKEVRSSFENYLFSTFSDRDLSENRIFLNKIISSLKDNDIKKFIQLLKILFKNITYPLIENKENYYHSVFYLVIKLLGFEIETEVLTCDGSIDAVIKIENYIYVIEFKLGTARSAMKQIREKQYHLKYGNEGKIIILLGIGFNTKLKNIGDFIVRKNIINNIM